MSLLTFFKRLEDRIEAAAKVEIKLPASAKPADYARAQALAQAPSRMARPHAVNADFLACLLAYSSRARGIISSKASVNDQQLHLTCYESVVLPALEAHDAVCHSQRDHHRCFLRQQLLLKYYRAPMQPTYVRFDGWLSQFRHRTSLESRMMDQKAFGDYVTSLSRHTEARLPAETAVCLWVYDAADTLKPPQIDHCFILDAFSTKPVAEREAYHFLEPKFGDLRSVSGFYRTNFPELLKVYVGHQGKDERISVTFYDLQPAKLTVECNKLRSIEVDAIERKVRNAQQSPAWNAVASKNLELWLEADFKEEVAMAQAYGKRQFPTNVLYTQKTKLQEEVTLEQKRDLLLKVKRQFAAFAKAGKKLDPR